MLSQVATPNTRERALEVARELFTTNGYAGTSIADIADRLGVTKAAVYYHFRAKADLLNELISPMFVQLQALLDAPPAEPRELLERVVALLAEQHGTMNIVAGDPSVVHELDQCAPVEFFGRLIQVLAGPRASESRRLRARCALGAIHGAVVGPVLEARAVAGRSGVPAGAAPSRQTAGPPAGPPADPLADPPAGPAARSPDVTAGRFVPMTAHERRVVVDAALAALG